MNPPENKTSFAPDIATEIPTKIASDNSGDTVDEKQTDQVTATAGSNSTSNTPVSEQINEQINEQSNEKKPEVLTGDEKIPLLLLLLFPSALRAAIASIPQWIRFKLIAFFGVCSMIAPLALWIAPSMTIWLSILGGSLLSIFFCWALVWFGPEDHY